MSRITVLKSSSCDNFKRAAETIAFKRAVEQRRDLLCNDSNGDLFTREDNMFSRESLTGISLVFI